MTTTTTSKPSSAPQKDHVAFLQKMLDEEVAGFQKRIKSIETIIEAAREIEEALQGIEDYKKMQAIRNKIQES